MSDITPEFVQVVSDWTGVPAEFLTGDTAADVWDSAARAEAWRVSTSAPAPPLPPPTAAVSASVPYKPITPQPLGEVSVMDAYRQGRLADRGAPVPPPRAPRSRRGMPW
jgi:hypothetical protein